MSVIKPERIQKLLAGAGLASRRQVEAWIAAGRLSVNGTPAQLGDKATASDQFNLDGKPLTLQAEAEKPLVLMLNKGCGVIATANDPQQRQTVFNLLPTCPSGRWIMVGRLDINTEGLLLFTNVGELAHRLMHPSYEVERAYRVRVHGRWSETKLLSLLQGVVLEDGPAKFDTMQERQRGTSNHWFDVTLASGRNRLVRRLWESQDFQVSRLIRIRYAEIELPEVLPVNQVSFLKPQQIHALFQSVSLSP
jgi:23S rRNA pseudouridine2605 synthase